MLLSDPKEQNQEATIRENRGGHIYLEMGYSLKKSLTDDIIALETCLFKRYNDFNDKCYCEIMLSYKKLCLGELYPHLETNKQFL